MLTRRSLILGAASAGAATALSGGVLAAKLTQERARNPADIVEALLLWCGTPPEAIDEQSIQEFREYCDRFKSVDLVEFSLVTDLPTELSGGSQ